jgi:two-component system nitrate/nitrite response regulator NarL
VRTLVVCDVEPVALEGVRCVLEACSEITLSAAETHLDQALATVREMAPTVLLVDKAFGIQAVMSVLKALENQRSRTAVVVWGVPLPEAEALRYLQSGAAAVIRKTAPVELLLECLRAVCAGETWVEPGVLLSHDHPPRLARTALTSRELQVMELVERGMKNKDIGAALGIRTGTVKIHLKHIFEKTGIRGRYGLALSGLQAKGLLALPAAEVG